MYATLPAGCPLMVVLWHTSLTTKSMLGRRSWGMCCRFISHIYRFHVLVRFRGKTSGLKYTQLQQQYCTMKNDPYLVNLNITSMNCGFFFFHNPVHYQAPPKVNVCKCEKPAALTKQQHSVNWKWSGTELLSSPQF